MIIEFTVKNYKSIKDEQTLSLLASKNNELKENVISSPNEEEYNLLKSVVIYGANAHGKSNIIEALSSFIEMIIHSTDYKKDIDIPVYNPYKLDKNYKTKQTMFDIEFISTFDKIRYKYIVEFNRKEIIYESLSYFPHKKEVNIFIRKKDEDINFGSALKGPKKTIEKILTKNTLFLSKGANNNNKHLEDIYSYFQNIHYPLLYLNNDNPFINDMQTFLNINTLYNRSMTTKLINKNTKFKDNLINLLKVSDIGIEKIDVEEEEIPHPIETEKTTKFKKIVSYHKSNNNELIKFNFLSDESEGTKMLYELAGGILEVLQSEKGGIVIIDELNNGLHPLLSQLIINLFHNNNTNKNNSQLIITTHDTTLLTNKFFRRDQIWFVEKVNSETKVYSLSDFSSKIVRKDTPFDKWYLSGKFGALPLIQDIDLIDWK